MGIETLKLALKKGSITESDSNRVKKIFVKYLKNQ
jgi:hypothetical protein